MKTFLKKLNWANKILLVFAVVLFILLVQKTVVYQPWARIYWNTDISDRDFHPMYLEKGYFTTGNGALVAFSDDNRDSDQPITGIWGYGSGEIEGEFELPPKKVYLEWLSLTERKWYKGEFELPEKTIEKILKLGKKKPKIMYSFFAYQREELGFRFLAGLEPKGKISIFMTGNNYIKLIATYTAKPFQPDWKKMHPDTKETESQFIDKIYLNIDSAERAKIQARRY